MDELLRGIQEVDPLWAVVLAAAALAVLLIAKFWSASFFRVFGALALVATVAGIAVAGVYGFHHFEDARRLEERRALDDRAMLLFDRAVQPESVFACIDGSPVRAVQEACERNLFAEPQRVAAAVAIVTQRLSFLADALAFIEKRDSGYSARIEPLRRSIESDPYGFVAFVLSVEHGCAADACARFTLFRAPERVRENLRVRRLEAFLARYSAAWRGDAPAPAEAAAAPAAGRTIAPLVTISGGETASEPAPAETPQVAAQPAQPPAPELPAAPTAGVTISEPPAAAVAPSITTPGEGEGFAAKREAASIEATPAAAPPPAAAKGTPARPPAQAKAKAKAEAKAVDPVSRRTNEPVAGLPRVVPRDYIREKEEEKEEPKPQASGQQPGAPMQLAPPTQNFTGR